MKAAKAIAVHIISAAITGYIGLVIGRHLQESYEPLVNSELRDPVIWTVLFLLALAYFASILLVDRCISYFWFFFSPEYRACGLYAEVFYDASGPRISLMVVYYDLAREELKITGNSYRQDKDERTRLNPWASWDSRVLHHAIKRNYTDVAYIHDSEVGKSTHEWTLGTTRCRLPTSEMFFQVGSFCDWKDIDHIELTNFELIRLQETHQREFFGRVTGLRTRLLCFLKLGAPTDEDFLSYVSERSAKLLYPPPGAQRGPIMSEVREALKSAKD